MLKKHWTYLIFVGLLAGCSGAVLEHEESPVYTFAVAGHAYGNPETFTSSVYPKLLLELDSLGKKRPIDQLILTGDVVAHPTEENWETVRKELDSLQITEWHIAPGNHDISPYMDLHIQAEKYMAFEKANCLFLILNTSFSGWSIDSLQQVFLKEQLKNVDGIQDIFVFSHQLWWLKNSPISFQLDSIKPNSYALYEGETDFWQDAFPYFENLKQDVHFFAGDIGCHHTIKGYYEDHFNNFHFYGSGMGGAVEDNLIYVRIFQDSTVKIDRIDF